MPPTTRGAGRALIPSERTTLVELLESGAAIEEAASSVNCAISTAYRVFASEQLRRRRSAHAKQRECELRLCLDERELISRGLAAGQSMRSIGRELKRAPSTISREISACGGRERYRALAAEKRAIGCARRPKLGKLARCPKLRAEVEAMLCKRYSPEQISAKLKRINPDDPDMQLSPETIYRSLYIQSRGELRRQLTENLRTKRTKRRSRGRGLGKRGTIRGMVPISERPPEVEDRAVPGHWEGDLIVGAYGRSFIATLVERQSRYVLLARLGNDGTTEHVIEALKERIRDLPRHLLLSLTWDQGKELAAHARLTKEAGIDVYFCDPHSPWQRGSNENTNGLLRQYLPKGSEIAAELNGRPRETLGWDSPAERMEELLR